jgi:hypothetical protein
MRGEFPPGVAGICKEARIMPQGQPEGGCHIEPGAPIEIGASCQQEIIMDIGQHA